MNRRFFLLAAPAIVAAPSLMKLSVPASVPRFEINMLPPWIPSREIALPVRNALIYGLYGGYDGYSVIPSYWERDAKEITGVSDLMRGAQSA